MAGYPVIDPAGVDIYDEEGNLTHYDLGDTVPLSKLISRRYSWLVNRGYLSEVETDDWGTAAWGEITGTLSAQTDLQSALDAKLNLTGGTLTGALNLTGDLTVSKASPILRLNASAATHTNLYLDSPAGYAADITFRSGTAARWAISKMNTAESGSDVGSDFQIFKYADSGTYTVPFKITRASGDITLDSTTDSSSSITGAVTTAGGMGIAKKLYVGTDLNGSILSGNDTVGSKRNTDCNTYHNTLYRY